MKSLNAKAQRRGAAKGGSFSLRRYTLASLRYIRWSLMPLLTELDFVWLSELQRFRACDAGIGNVIQVCAF
jgi:hypothetical protein